MKRAICAGLILSMIGTAAWARHHAWVGVNGMGAFGPDFAGGSAANVTPTTPCVGGQLDFSDPTGCNTTLYMVLLR